MILVFSLWVLPTAEATPPKALKTLSGSLDPGDITSLSWDLNRDVSEFLFHYVITGGADEFDVVYVSIDETGDLWDSLMGEGWAYCDCPLSAGPYTVTVEADADATDRINFNVGFYQVPQAPVEFAGFIPANSITRVSGFGVLFPSAGGNSLVLGVTAGSYEFFIDGVTQGVVTETRSLPLEVTGDFHLFEVSSLSVGADEDVRWSVDIQGEPKLQVSIVNACPVLNPEAGQSVCVTGAEVTASDGGTPTISYLWTATGGEFNSTTSQWVQWTAPAGVTTYSITVQASAPGYVSDSDSLTVQVVPEFLFSVIPLMLMLVLAFTVVFDRRRRNRTV